MARRRGMTLGLAAASALALAAPGTASAGDVVKVRDVCDPQTFNDAFGPGTCVRESRSGGLVTLPEFLQAFPAGHRGWRFTDAKIDHGDALDVRFDRGGEFHTFSRVLGPEFGPGCVKLVNELMGLTGPPVIDCAKAFTDPAEFIGVGFPRTSVAGLDRGQHRFICAIHPWMKSTVRVR